MHASPSFTPDLNHNMHQVRFRSFTVPLTVFHISHTNRWFAEDSGNTPPDYESSVAGLTR